LRPKVHQSSIVKLAFYFLAEFGVEFEFILVLRKSFSLRRNYPQTSVDDGFEVLAIHGIHLGRHLQGKAGAAGDEDGAIEAFFRRCPAKEVITPRRVWIS
jgi:hypothetical protein